MILSTQLLLKNFLIPNFKFGIKNGFVNIQNFLKTFGGIHIFHSCFQDQ